VTKITIAEPVENTPRKGFTPRQRIETLLACKGRCVKCAEKVGDDFEIDHRIPLAQGGLHEPGNWQIVCKPCHLGKSRGDNADTRKAKRRMLKHTGNWPAPKGNHRLQPRPFPKTSRSEWR